MTSVPSGRANGGGAAGGTRTGGNGGARRRNVGASSNTAAPARPRNNASSGAGMWRFYAEDSPGLKVGPLPVLISSLVFIASVFMLHIWGKYTRG
ncbi:hypothetical protein SNEBB_002402 [Seison nebaliae]|nr:hypothetical protein SNEBB_002402 [Seison nebaliae]